jgi:SAM-dependent methyltransferase
MRTKISQRRKVILGLPRIGVNTCFNIRSPKCDDFEKNQTKEVCDVVLTTFQLIAQDSTNNMSKEVKGAAYWDERFQAPSYAYGEAPNDFLVWAAPQVKLGKAVSLCEGEGRNAVYLAKLGFEVTAVDFSSVGLAKAKALADLHKVTLHYVVADLKEFQLENNAWDLVVSVFAQPDAAIRQRLYAQLGQSLTSGGAFILESKVSEADSSNRYPGVATLSADIKPLQIAFSQQGERELNEGSYHVGMHTTAQILAFKN